MTEASQWSRSLLRMRICRLSLLAVLVALGPCLGCEKTVREPMSAAQYQKSAQEAYDHALRKFFAKDWINALALMQDVKREYPGTRVARLAQLRIADTHFHQSAYPEAITAYREFLRDFPSDGEIPYARYRIILCLFESRGESIMAPPLEERDLANIRDADRAIYEFIRDYPEYEEKERVRYMQLWVRGMLARHELYVARFYLKESKWDAALARTEYALLNYRDTGLEPEALVLLGETRLRKGDTDLARAAFQRVIDEYPSSAFAEPSRRFLMHMGESGRPTVETNY